MLSKTVNQRVLNSMGKYNYNQYMLITGGKEIDDILDSRNSVFELYNYRPVSYTHLTLPTICSV